MTNQKMSPQTYYLMLHQKRETELLLSALRMDLFSLLKTWETPNQIAIKTGFNERNLSFYLNALASIGHLEKKGEVYRNTQESNQYFNKESNEYLGEYLLFREKMMSLGQLEERIIHGPDDKIKEANSGVEVYDFYEAARVGIAEMYTGRIQAFNTVIQELFKDCLPKKILDLGGGSGCFVIELVQCLKGAKGVIFEHPSVAPLPRKLIEEKGLTKSIKVMEGNFNTDDIGEGYDLIIASGIMDFAKDYLDELVAKLAKALSIKGYLYIVTNEVSEDYQNPPQAIVGWLSSHLDGLDLLLTRKDIDEALKRQGLECVQNKDAGGMLKGLAGRFYQLTKEVSYEEGKEHSNHE